MKFQNNHAHAICRYAAISIADYIFLLKSFIIAKYRKSISLTAHLPLEVMHPQIYKNISLARIYILFGEFLKKIFQLNLYWENAPLLEYGTWKLKYGQMDWNLIPNYINICLDTGHLMLGETTILSARNKIKKIIKLYGPRIKHLHLHENDFVSDRHLAPSRIITKNILKNIMRGRSYIFEK